ncbi:MAG TPA: hypothetical protein VGZ02_15825 [Candidatus Baltobacteraceae bacterium]|jgi:hypothetical protein|nr:hypothetical protein [Candidatus Baltobacteraceae bacterium]
MLRRFAFLLLALAFSLPPGSGALAARPILDYHRLDAFYALYAHDSNVPWKPTSVRLDTFTSAPLDFSVYQVDPADVIVAGSNTRPRAIDTRRLKAIASWRYTPPGGYRFQSNDVDVPLGSREGFFVVEARRGGVGQQVWIDRTRIGLLSKETPAGITLYATDLANGRALPHVRVSFIVNARFADRYTDRRGIVQWRGSPRPLFAIAQWGNSSSFVSFLPQAPLPQTIVGVKTDTAVVHAGDELHVVGFARTRSGSRLRPSTGYATLSLRSYSATVAQNNVRLDAAGAFDSDLRVPDGSRAGDYTVMATVAGSTAGTMVHVDANAAGLSLNVASKCEGACDPSQDVPVVVRAMRAGQPVPGVDVDVDIIRSPHAYAGEAPAQPWGIAQWFDGRVTTGSDGRAAFTIPHPDDGLASTYGVRASSGGATADTRIIVPNGTSTLRLQVDRTDIGSSEAAAFDVYENDVATGKPVAGSAVRVQLVHGASIQEQQITLDDHGHAHAAFTAPQVGSNLIIAQSGRAMDAAEVMVEPQTMQMQVDVNQSVGITLDKKRYAGGDDARLHASLVGAQGQALLTMESATGTELRVVPVTDGQADASFKISGGAGVLAAGAAFVRDGELEWGSVPVTVDAPGRPLSVPLILDKPSYEPGATAIAKLDGLLPGEGTMIVRITQGVPTGSAYFANAPDLLEVGTTATQDTALGVASWHPGVDSTGEHALVQTFLRRSAPPADMAMTEANTASVYWKVDRASGDSTAVIVPQSPGKYHLSLLKIDDDGRVTAASSDLIVSQ